MSDDPINDAVPVAARAGQGVTMPDVSERVCRHCGRKTGITYGTIPIGSGLSATLCHTSDPNRPDCYRRVTVYREPLGILKIAEPVPNGVENIRRPG